MGEERRGVALNPGWRERYLGESPEKEAELLRAFAEQIQHVQERNRRRQGEPLRRAFHAKPLAGIVNARLTLAVEDGTVEWTDPHAPPETVAELVIPRQDLTRGEPREGEPRVEALAFSPWNSTEGIRPIGGLNRARKPVYQASARFRSRGS